jgi:hypothetical protein
MTLINLIKKVIFLAMVVPLFYVCNSTDNRDNNIEFTQIIVGGPYWVPSSDEYIYNEYVLVANMPNGYLEKGKTMIAYVDSVRFPIKPEIKSYKMWFYESTKGTRAYYINGYKNREPAIEDYLGIIAITRCDRDSTKWSVRLDIATGIRLFADGYGWIYERTALLNECSFPWGHIVNENIGEELVRYYMALKGEENVSRHWQRIR